MPASAYAARIGGGRGRNMAIRRRSEGDNDKHDNGPKPRGQQQPKKAITDGKRKAEGNAMHDSGPKPRGQQQPKANGKRQSQGNDDKPKE